MHPDLPLALGDKPGRIWELSLVLGKGLDAAGDLVSLARQRGEASDGQGAAEVVLSTPNPGVCLQPARVVAPLP